MSLDYLKRSNQCQWSDHTRT